MDNLLAATNINISNNEEILNRPNIDLIKDSGNGAPSFADILFEEERNAGIDKYITDLASTEASPNLSKDYSVYPDRAGLHLVRQEREEAGTSLSSRDISSDKTQTLLSRNKSHDLDDGKYYANTLMSADRLGYNQAFEDKKSDLSASVVIRREGQEKEKVDLKGRQGQEDKKEDRIKIDEKWLINKKEGLKTGKEQVEDKAINLEQGIRKSDEKADLKAVNPPFTHLKDIKEGSELKAQGSGVSGQGTLKDIKEGSGQDPIITILRDILLDKDIVPHAPGLLVALENVIRDGKLGREAGDKAISVLKELLSRSGDNKLKSLDSGLMERSLKVVGNDQHVESRVINMLLGDVVRDGKVAQEAGDKAISVLKELLSRSGDNKVKSLDSGLMERSLKVVGNDQHVESRVINMLLGDVVRDGKVAQEAGDKAISVLKELLSKSGDNKVKSLDSGLMERSLKDVREVEDVKRWVTFDKTPNRVSDDVGVIKVNTKKDETRNPLNRLATEAMSEGRYNLESGLNRLPEGKNEDAINLERIFKTNQGSVSFKAVNGDPQGQNNNNDMSQRHGKKGEADNGGLMDFNTGFRGVGDKLQISSKTETSENANKSTTNRSVPASRIGEVIVQAARRFQNGGNSELHLEINKPDLGNLKISFIENPQGKLGIMVMAERADAAELIRQNTSEIRQMLLQQGIDLSGFEVFDQDRGKGYYLAQRDFLSRKVFNRNLSREDDPAWIMEVEDRATDLAASLIGLNERTGRLNLLV